MANNESRPNRHRMAYGTTYVTIAFGLLLLLLGLSVYIKQRNTVHVYQESMCRVSKTELEDRKCDGYTAKYTCVAALWRVQHSDLKSINATVQEEYRSTDPNKAVEAQGKYEVRIVTRHWMVMTSKMRTTRLCTV